jgi:hypothetical protein
MFKASAPMYHISTGLDFKTKKHMTNSRETVPLRQQSVELHWFIHKAV